MDRLLLSFQGLRALGNIHVCVYIYIYIYICYIYTFFICIYDIMYSVQFSFSVMSDSL